MSYTVENVNECTKKLVFNFESVDLSTQIEKALENKQKTASLKGFRKGKAPKSTIEQLYGAQVENEALYSFVSQEFYAAIQKEQIRAVGYPSFGNTDYEKEKSTVKFSATVEIIPNIELKDYASYTFRRRETR